MKVSTWLADRRKAVDGVLTTNDAGRTGRNYALAGALVGFIAGALLAKLFALFALGAAVLLGIGIGYAIRSYVSHRRRDAFRRRQGSSWPDPTVQPLQTAQPPMTQIPAERRRDTVG